VLMFQVALKLMRLLFLARKPLNEVWIFIGFVDLLELVSSIHSTLSRISSNGTMINASKKRMMTPPTNAIMRNSSILAGNESSFIIIILAFPKGSERRNNESRYD